MGQAVREPAFRVRPYPPQIVVFNSYSTIYRLLVKRSVGEVESRLRHQSIPKDNSCEKGISVIEITIKVA